MESAELVNNLGATCDADNSMLIDVKLPIVCVYTCRCAANIVEKYERGLVVG